MISELNHHASITAKSLAIICFLFSLLFGPRAQSQIVGKAVSLAGDIRVDRGGKSTLLNVGDSISEGDRVTTAKGAGARFLLIDDSVIDLKENSAFKFIAVKGIEEKRDVEFELDFGSVRASVNKKVDRKGNYNIKTKASVFAVRGTDFNVDSTNEKSSGLTVFEGVVASDGGARASTVSKGGELRIRDGQSTSRLLSPTELENIYALSRIEDINVFQNIVVGDFKVSRNFGSATIKEISGFGLPPAVVIPKDSYKIPGVYKLNAGAVSPGVLNFVNTSVGVKIQ